MTPNISDSPLTNVLKMYSRASTITDGDSSGENSVWTDEMGSSSDQLFFVTSYSDFDKLAHGPRGTEAPYGLYVYRFHPTDGSLVLLNIHGNVDEVTNPAFSRFHPRLNVVYTCTEDIKDNGQIFAHSIGANGELAQIGQVDAGGTSTCYLTIDKSQKNILAVNYWDSTIVVIPISQETGEFIGSIKNIYDPKCGKEMVAAAKKFGGVNHSKNDESTIKQRQQDPHSHALVLDPVVGSVAYVPDLGKDLIREFFYDKEAGAIVAPEMNVLPSGLCTGKPDGPRYFEFHPKYDVAYVVNELSSTVAVFAVDKQLLHEIARAAKRRESMDQFRGRSSLTLVQSISTLPPAFPTTMNTCGRICVHQSGRFVIVSNRGHESIAIFRVQHKGRNRGKLRAVGYFHTRGETPRHFQFDSSGQFLIVANQDTNSISVFTFNLSSGEIKFTGNEYRVPSPNFVCCCPVRDDELGIQPSENESDCSEKTLDWVPQSDLSSIPVNAREKDLESELRRAELEIERLKKQISSTRD